VSQLRARLIAPLPAPTATRLNVPSTRRLTRAAQALRGGHWPVVPAGLLALLGAAYGGFEYARWQAAGGGGIKPPHSPSTIASDRRSAANRCERARGKLEADQQADIDAERRRSEEEERIAAARKAAAEAEERREQESARIAAAALEADGSSSACRWCSTKVAATTARLAGAALTHRRVLIASSQRLHKRERRRAHRTRWSDDGRFRGLAASGR